MRKTSGYLNYQSQTYRNWDSFYYSISHKIYKLFFFKKKLFQKLLLTFIFTKYDYYNYLRYLNTIQTPIHLNLFPKYINFPVRITRILIFFLKNYVIFNFIIFKNYLKKKLKYNYYFLI